MSSKHSRSPAGLPSNAAVGAFRRRWAPVIDRALERGVLEDVGPAGTLTAPALYWFRVKGRRVRPLAVLAACELVGGRGGLGLDAACAIEWIHTSSLILDDLPCMDDAAERRGAATLHRVYGEATAILTALLLFNLAHRQLARLPMPTAGASHERICRLVGATGMIGGQDIDLRLSRGEPLPPNLDVANMRASKTTSLMVCALELGGAMGGGVPAQIDALGRFGFRLGRLLQTVDDLVDGESAIGGAFDGRDAPAWIEQEHRRMRAELHAAFREDTPPRRVLEDLVELVSEPGLSVAGRPREVS